METTSPAGGSLQLLLLLAFLVPAIFFLITQQNILKVIKPENRLMQPGLVWLQLIPFFGNIWQFFVIIRIARSIQKQQAAPLEDTIFGADAAFVEQAGSALPTQGIGIAYAVLDTVVVLIGIAGRSAEITAVLIAWGMIICWIIYWVQLARHKNKLKRSLALG